MYADYSVGRVSPDRFLMPDCWAVAVGIANYGGASVSLAGAILQKQLQIVLWLRYQEDSTS